MYSNCNPWLLTYQNPQILVFADVCNTCIFSLFRCNYQHNSCTVNSSGCGIFHTQDTLHTRIYLKLRMYESKLHTKSMDLTSSILYIYNRLDSSVSYLIYTRQIERTQYSYLCGHSYNQS